MSTESNDQSVMDISDFEQIFKYLEQDQLENGFRFVPEPVYYDFMTECEQPTTKANFPTKEEKENLQFNKIPALLISSILEDAAESNEVSPTFISDQPFAAKTDSSLSAHSESSNVSAAIEDVDETNDTRSQTAAVEGERDVEHSNTKFECQQHMSDTRRDESPADKDAQAA